MEQAKASPANGWARAARRPALPRRLSAPKVYLLCLEVVGAFAVGLWQVMLRSREEVDFLAFLTAARMLDGGQARQLYDFAAQYRAQLFLAPHRDAPLVFINPPFFALALAPLGGLPYALAYSLWAVLNLAMVVGAVWLLTDAVGLQGARRALAVLSGLTLVPVYILMFQGQANGVMLLALAAGARWWLAGRRGRAGLVWPLALVKPHLVVLSVAVPLLRRAPLAVAASVAAVGLLVAATLPVLGLAAWRDWLAAVLPLLDHHRHDITFSGGQVRILGGALAAVGVSQAAQVAAAVLIAGGSGLALALARREEALVLALAAAASFAIAPYMNSHDPSLLLVPGLLLAGRLLAGACRRPRLGWLVLGTTWVCCELVSPTRLAPVGVASLLLAAYLAVELLGPRPAAPVAEAPGQAVPAPSS